MWLSARAVLPPMLQRLFAAPIQVRPLTLLFSEARVRARAEVAVRDLVASCSIFKCTRALSCRHVLCVSVTADKERASARR